MTSVMAYYHIISNLACVARGLDQVVLSVVSCCPDFHSQHHTYFPSITSVLAAEWTLLRCTAAPTLVMWCRCCSGAQLTHLADHGVRQDPEVSH